jgi:hypothetical protein
MYDDIFLQLLSKNHSQELTMLYSRHSSGLSILLAPMVVVDLQGLQPL